MTNRTPVPNSGGMSRTITRIPRKPEPQKT